ncbi:MAG: hypothetical protein L3J04_06390 [Robiginitomaculum sp.]|nr:hypothetical protein [Robiginitomaculum sp.]
MQRLAFGLLFLFVVGLGACTTISSGSNFSTKMDAKEVHPIKVKADALVELFTLRGWAVKADPEKQVNKFASLITGGWGKSNKEPANDAVDTYLNSLNDNLSGQVLQQAMLNEINLASGEISSLSQRVELSVASINSDMDLRSGMLSLEKAVLTSRKANKLFALAASRSGFSSTEMKTGLQGLQTNITLLTRQADSMHETRRSELRGLFNGSS